MKNKYIVLKSRIKVFQKHVKTRYTRKNYDLFNVDKSRIEQCCASHIVQCCTTIFFNIVTPDCLLSQAQQYCSVLLTTLNNVGSTTLFNPSPYNMRVCEFENKQNINVC